LYREKYSAPRGVSGIKVKKQTEAILEIGITVEELAAESGISPSSLRSVIVPRKISRFKRSKQEMKVKKQIEAILETGVTVEELANEVGISKFSLRSVLGGRGVISKYGIEKLTKYCTEKNIPIQEE